MTEIMTLMVTPLTLMTTREAQWFDEALPMIECWQPIQAACWAPVKPMADWISAPPEGAMKRAWISSGLKKEGEKVWRSLASDEECLRRGWKPLHEFKY